MYHCWYKSPAARKNQGQASLTASEYMDTRSNLMINGGYCGAAKCWQQPLGWIGAKSEDGGAGPSHSISNTGLFFFLAELGLRRDAQASHCGGFSCCRAQTLGRMRSTVVQELSASMACGIKPMSLALAGRCLTTGPPGKPPMDGFLTRGWASFQKAL